jgi:hypothetical protein
MTVALTSDPRRSFSLPLDAKPEAHHARRDLHTVRESPLPQLLLLWPATMMPRERIAKFSFVFSVKCLEICQRNGRTGNHRPLMFRDFLSIYLS